MSGAAATCSAKTASPNHTAAPTRCDCVWAPSARRTYRFVSRSATASTPKSIAAVRAFCDSVSRSASLRANRTIASANATGFFFGTFTPAPQRLTMSAGSPTVRHDARPAKDHRFHEIDRTELLAFEWRNEHITAGEVRFVSFWRLHLDERHAFSQTELFDLIHDALARCNGVRYPWNVFVFDGNAVIERRPVHHAQLRVRHLLAHFRKCGEQRLIAAIRAELGHA